MSSSSSTQKQQRHRINYSNIQQSRNTNAYFDRNDYYRQSLITKNNYWNQNFHESNNDFYMNDYYHQHRNIYSLSSRPIRKGKQIKNEQQHNSKTIFSSSSSNNNNNNNHAYYDNLPPRHRLQQQQQQQQQQIDKREQRSSRLQESRTNNKSDEIKLPNSSTKIEQTTKPLKSSSSSSTNSDLSNNPGSTHRKDLHAKNLAAAAIAARQHNSSAQTNLSTVQALMNSLILQQQQQQQQPPSQSQSTVQLQYQLTNALLGIMIQQRLKEATLQAQAQQIQATLPTLLAAQALVYQQQQQQQGQLTGIQQQTQSIRSPNIAHPGTKFNNRPLVKFPVIRPTMSPLSSTMMMPIIRPAITTNLSRHRLVTNSQQICSSTTLPTYQQVQEIERGISLDEAIHLKGAIDIADINNNSVNVEAETIQINNNITE
ncbi:unnamed protein product [Rotaria sordida]|uniref:Uncharacterized protein n=1 Tax=Rotaria sordida TaxID=392033 RepID=A0A813Q9H6_9BILA|nr:unnamed protein product [Rotaria sordida]